MRILKKIFKFSQKKNIKVFEIKSEPAKNKVRWE